MTFLLRAAKNFFLPLNLIIFLVFIFSHYLIWFPLLDAGGYLITITSTLFVASLFALFINYKKPKLYLLITIILFLTTFFVQPFLVQPLYFFYFLFFLFSYINPQQIIQNFAGLSLFVFMASAIQKINPYFFNEIVPYFFENPLAPFIGFVVIFLELTIPLFVLVKKSRGSIFLFSLLIIGVLFIALSDPNIHITVVFWVLVMYLGVLVWFFSDSDKKQPLFYNPIFFVVFLVSLLGYLGLGPSYLSFKIYSGNTNLGMVVIGQDQYLIEEIFFTRYSMYPPPQKRIYLTIFDRICDKENNSVLYIKNKEDWILSSEKVSVYTCS